MLRPFALLLLFCSTSLFAIDFSRYHNEDEINQYLRDLATANPTQVHFYNLGQSDENREINYITLTKGSEALPAMYYNGTHHGNEWSSTESILGFIDYLMTHQNDADVSYLLTHYVFYLQPMVNPDGHFHQTRADVNGADPNRDYTYPGGNPNTQFKTKIIPLVKKLLDSRKFHAAAAYHSGIEEVLWPWCYTDAPSQQNSLLYTLAKKTASSMNFDRYLQSNDDYATEGEFIDYAFWTQGTLSLTFEVSSDYTPAESELASVVTRAVTGSLAFAQAVSDYDQGKLVIENPARMTHKRNVNPLWEKLGFKLE